MKSSLPERPDPGQLKKQAKDLLHAIRAGRPEALARVTDATVPSAFGLHDAQRILAREYGFASWAKLKLHVESRTEETAEIALIEAALNGNSGDVETLFKERPGLGRRGIHAAAALGDAKGVSTWLGREPACAVQKGGPRDWPPLLYLCFGRCGGGDAERAGIAKTFIDAGADPNTSWTDPTWPESPQPALYGATGVNDFPQLARCLLEAGADPNDCESRYHAAEHHHVECLKVLKEFGADFSRRDRIWNNTPLYFLFSWQNPAANVRLGIRWLLENGADPNVPSHAEKDRETPLHAAIRIGWEIETIALLLDRGADPSARRADERTPYALAVRGAREDVAKLLRERGASEEVSTFDRFLGACMRGDEAAARSAVARNPNLMSELAPADQHLLHDAARDGRCAALKLMAKLGFDLATPDAGGATPLHMAAWQGRADAVNVLIENGAPLDVLDTRFQAPPISWAAHGSVFCKNPAGDYAACARALISAGAEVPQGIHGSTEVTAIIQKHFRNNKNTK